MNVASRGSPNGKKTCMPNYNLATTIQSDDDALRDHHNYSLIIVSGVLLVTKTSVTWTFIYIFSPVTVMNAVPKAIHFVIDVSWSMSDPIRDAGRVASRLEVCGDGEADSCGELIVTRICTYTQPPRHPRLPRRRSST